MREINKIQFSKYSIRHILVTFPSIIALIHLLLSLLLAPDLNDAPVRTPIAAFLPPIDDHWQDRLWLKLAKAHICCIRVAPTQVPEHHLLDDRDM